jgi:hypothetical protein
MKGEDHTDAVEVLLSDDDENLHRFVTALALTQRVEIMLLMMMIEVNDGDALCSNANNKKPPPRQKIGRSG